MVHNASMRLFALALAITFCWYSAGAGTMVSLSPSTKSVPPSGVATLDVVVANASNVRAASVTFTFNNAVLRYNGATQGEFLSDQYSTFFYAPSGGSSVSSVAVDQAILGPGGASGNGVLFTVTLAAVKAGRSSVTISAVDLIDVNNTHISPSIQSGEVVVEQPVPVQLVSFTGNLLYSRDVLLEWKTVSEINNYGFEVEKSAERTANYQTIPGSFIAGHGTTNVPREYSYLDSSAVAGCWYYRLKQIDLDGTIHYTDGIRVAVVTAVRDQSPSGFRLFQNYPNPFNPATEIRFSVASTARTILQVYNMLGEQVGVLFDDVAEMGHYYTVRFDAANMASGTYFFRLQSGGKTDMKKMTLLR